MILIPGILVAISIVGICAYLIVERYQELKRPKPDNQLYWNMTNNELLNITMDYPRGSLIREMGDRLDQALQGINDEQ